MIIVRHIDIQAPLNKTFRNGQSITVWRNPLNKKEFSTTPRHTDYTPSYYLIYSSITLFILGLIFIFQNKQWIHKENLIDNKTETTQASFSQLHEIKKKLQLIDWYQFEKVAKRILESDQWQVEPAGGAKADGGVDLLASKANRKFAVQCKHWKNICVDVKVPRELLGSKHSTEFNVTDAMLFSLSDLTQPAKKFAEENNIMVLTGKDIEKRIQLIGVEEFPELMNPNDKYCPKCGASMVLRVKARRPFWGCSSFPKCRGIIK